jgi:hypothetical protein
MAHTHSPPFHITRESKMPSCSHSTTHRAVLLAFAIGACGLVAGTYSASAQDTKLVGISTQAAVVGNTLDGTIGDKGQTTIYLDPNGNVKIKQDDKVDTGKWSFTATDLCLDFKRPAGPECVGFEVTGAKATITHDGEALGTLDILKGNAKNL